MITLHSNRLFDGLDDSSKLEELKLSPVFSTGDYSFDKTTKAPVVPDVIWDYDPVLTGRSACNFTGLKNGGATCYMNAVVQQLFMQPGVAERILEVSSEKLDESSLLYQMQEVRQ